MANKSAEKPANVTIKPAIVYKRTAPLSSTIIHASVRTGSARSLHHSEVGRACPLWVKSRHPLCETSCRLCRRKRTCGGRPAPPRLPPAEPRPDMLEDRLDHMRVVIDAELVRHGEQ